MKPTLSFNKKELEDLCILYREGHLSREEEKFLHMVLSDSTDLSEEASDTLKLMDAEKLVYSKKRRNFKSRWVYSSVAASILIACGIAIPVTIHHSHKTDETFVVWQDGKRITGKEAKEIAEENQRENMEMMRQIMKQQREMMKRNFASVNMDEYDL